ncbi:class I SAM-dependent DNA methyltransferase [Rhodovulum sp. YNF3179]|uniref:class I SAM-dependent DNA methyltransferase n=1 Tax=Rhodovulum sp. YNF3179 TaxID=3425127 RepID=UPI003D334200
MDTENGSGGGALASLREGSTDSEAVQSYYDDWADSYDETLADWDYKAPADATALLVPHLDDGARVLDVGCGTGLFGATLARRGTYRIDGIDISSESLAQARDRRCYGELIQHDLQKLPLPVPADAYDGAACIGVLTYIEDAEALLRAVCRCVRPGGIVTFTQRSDRWDTLSFADTVARLDRDGLWETLHVSAPRDYLPGNDAFGAEIKVIHTLCRVA